MPKGDIRSFPRHPFPVLAGEHPPTHGCRGARLELTKAERRVLEIMRGGGRILLDINAKRGLVYTFSRGARVLAEVTVRAISRLLRTGALAVCGRIGGVVHYALPSQAQHMNWWLRETDEDLLQVS